MGSSIPPIDPGARDRLTLRLGSHVEAWLDRLPGVLAEVAAEWGIELESAIPYGSVSVVLRCRLADGRAAVLKSSPDRARLEFEAAAVAGWEGVHVPAVLALDERRGVLLLEAIEPGTSIATSDAYPPIERIGELLSALHAPPPDSSYPSVGDRVDYLFESSRKLYRESARLADLVPRPLYERGRALAALLSTDRVPRVLLHGDLTPANVLDGGPRRGLVAIDAAPCVGDAAFDVVDLVLWQAKAVGIVERRADRLSALIGADAGRMAAWCRAFAAVLALELASAGSDGGRIGLLLELRAQA